ncbi:uncharacterized protein LOC131543763 [Onychostoma macrolepis]|uniref:uncharacterized protein LOC131543763 n=1 Tax=Onychostoma macrolepis TaxID=369639 RepID=UPI0027296653|nr:uncharacterized protein LOC131543763 [Onychostoma macrolepis]
MTEKLFWGNYEINYKMFLFLLMFTYVLIFTSFCKRVWCLALEPHCDFRVLYSDDRQEDKNGHSYVKLDGDIVKSGFIPSSTLWSSVTPASLQSSVTLAPPTMLVAAAVPRSLEPAMTLSSIGPPSVPSGPPALSPLVGPQMSAATPSTSWLLAPSTPPCVVSTGMFWVCAMCQASKPPGHHRHPPITIPSPHPAIIPAAISSSTSKTPSI